jgi:hypothetical protein
MARIRQYDRGMSKRRLTITVDHELADAAAAASAAGDAESVSAWVSEAMAQRVARDEQLAALGELIAVYEDEHGEITDDELAEQEQADRDAAASRRKARSS